MLICLEMAINFNHQLALVSKEVNDETEDSLLSPDLEAIELFAMQPPLSFRFLQRHRML